VEMFKKAYSRSLFAIRKSGSKWTFHFKLVHHLKKGGGRQRKNRIKDCLEGGSGGSKSSSNATKNQNKKTKQMVRGKVRCLNCGELGHRKTS
jgi:hypothetical protein